MIKVKIGETIAIYENGKWHCAVSAFRETLESFTELERRYPPPGYAPDRSHPPALRAAHKIGEVIEQPEAKETDYDENVRY